MSFVSKTITECRECFGDGQELIDSVACWKCHGKSVNWPVKRCDQCSNRGVERECSGKPCPKCGGTGQVITDHPVSGYTGPLGYSSSTPGFTPIKNQIGRESSSV